MPFSFRALSIRQQLPLLICLLLLVLILLFGTISYMGIRRASMAIGQQRLRSLTEQLSSLFQQSARTLAAGTRVISNSEDIVDYFGTSPGRQPSTARATEALEKLLVDTQTVWVELRDLQGKQLLQRGREGTIFSTRSDPTGETSKTRELPDAGKEIAEARGDSSFIGKFYLVGDSMYYPIAVAATRDGKAVGYLLRWRAVRATPKSVAQLSQLLGSKAALYIGNNDGSLWTDMVHPVPTPPLVMQNLHKTVSYDNPDGKVIAYAMPVPGSKWLITIELSQTVILEAADRFLYWIIGIGAVLVLTGSLIAWLISRNFTRPLERLMHATTAIASGDYSSPIPVDRRDEMGRLALSFNSMATQVRHIQEDLEQKVQSRTKELEAVNKELEAFSYSVSHDLRAPLRAVSGYAMMLKEDYEDSFDDEAKRITGNILANVKMMGRLIDDLIAFSQLGKREVRRQVTDMKELASTCVDELRSSWPNEKYLIDIGPLPHCNGDGNLLKQVWMNLIGNAMKYSSKISEPRIAIGSMEEAQGVVYFVRDNGAGFDMKYADKLFKVFQRLHGQDEFEGTGVGLALVKRILNKHKGEIWADSSPGNGAVFYFTLPSDEGIFNYDEYAQSSGSITGRRQCSRRRNDHPGLEKSQPGQ